MYIKEGIELYFVLGISKNYYFQKLKQFFSNKSFCSTDGLC